MEEGKKEPIQSHLSEFVGQPRGNVIYILPGTGLLKKAAGKKMTVNRDERQVAVNIPKQLRL